jgi:ferrochelatase
MGGPDTLDDVRPFLYNLFSDREIIRLGPPFLQKFLAYVISRRRAPKSSAIYTKIGGGSPLKKITLKQAEALQEALKINGDYYVTIAMRYWPPYGDEAVQNLTKEGVETITALTLYPHYSKATSGSSISHLQKSLQRLAPDIPATIISSWPTQGSYIKALADNIIKGVSRFDLQPVEIVYSAHSLPVSFIQEGDPYVDHIGQTIQAIEKITKQKGRICYQSRSGPVEWLSPSTPEMLTTLAQEGCKHILMVPISFVSDHVETLYEIDILYREQAAQLGMRLLSCESLNTNPLFIEGLRDLILQGSRAGNN